MNQTEQERLREAISTGVLGAIPFLPAALAASSDKALATQSIAIS